MPDAMPAETSISESSQPVPTTTAESTASYVFPSVYQFVSLLDDMHPHLDLPRFEPILRAYGYTSLSQLEHVSYDFLIHTVGMPGHVVDIFLEESRATIGRIRKGKAPVPSVKVEEEEESLGNEEEGSSSDDGNEDHD